LRQLREYAAPSIPKRHAWAIKVHTVRRCARRLAYSAVRYSSIGTAHHGYEFLDLPAPVSLVAGSNCVFPTVGDVITKDFLLDALQACTHRRDLCHDVDAIAVLLHHAQSVF